MAIQNELPYGRTGWHGDNAVSLRSTIGEAETLVNDLFTQYTGLLGELDTQAGTATVGDPTYDLVGITDPSSGRTTIEIPRAASAHIEAGPTVVRDHTLIHVAQGGSYTHGDNAVYLRLGLQDVENFANQLKTKMDALLALLDTNPGDGISDGDYVALVGINVPDMLPIHTRFANGGEAAHGDQGVAMRLALQSMVVILNEAKAQLNLLVQKLDADSTSSAYDPAYLVTADDIA